MNNTNKINEYVTTRIRKGSNANFDNNKLLGTIQIRLTKTFQRGYEREAMRILIITNCWNKTFKQKSEIYIISNVNSSSCDVIVPQKKLVY